MTFMSTMPVLPDGRKIRQATFLSEDVSEQVRFLEILCPGIQSKLVGTWGLGYAINDRRAFFVLDPEDDNWPTWIVIVPTDDDPESRVVVRAFEAGGEYLLDVYLEGDCDTTERRDALIEFGFDLLDEEPVMPPADGALLSMYVPATE
jgi:hypothetical protein